MCKKMRRMINEIRSVSTAPDRDSLCVISALQVLRDMKIFLYMEYCVFQKFMSDNFRAFQKKTPIRNKKTHKLYNFDVLC